MEEFGTLKGVGEETKFPCSVEFRQPEFLYLLALETILRGSSRGSTTKCSIILGSRGGSSGLRGGKLYRGCSHQPELKIWRDQQEVV